MQTVVIVAAAAGLLMLAERRWPAQPLPRVRHWWWRVAVFNSVQVAVVYLGALTWDRWLPTLRWFDTASLASAWAIAFGYLTITFIYYWWHRARHEVEPLWRCLHQLHHSPQRIEVAMSFYKHPGEIVLNGVLSSAVLTVLCGLSPQQAASVVAITGLAELVYHCNLRTPYWLGWFFQRPEMHRVHHQRDWHRCNYSDLPLWDVLFGTYRNPRTAPQQCGFAGDGELQIARMLIGRAPR